MDDASYAFACRQVNLAWVVETAAFGSAFVTDRRLVIFDSLDHL